MKRLLIFLFLIGFVNAQGSVTVKIFDIINQHGEYVYVFQNDNMSHGYIETYNISGEPFGLSANHGYTLQLEPSYNSIITNPQDSQFTSYWWNYILYFSFTILILIIIIISLRRVFK